MGLSSFWFFGSITTRCICSWVGSSAVRSMWWINWSSGVKANGGMDLSTRTTSSIRKCFQGSVQQALCEWLQCLCLSLCHLLEIRSWSWGIVLSYLPKASPISQSLIHSLRHGCHSIWSFPSQLTTLQTPKQAFEAFLMPFLKPLAILQGALFLSMLLGFLELMSNGL